MEDNTFSVSRINLWDQCPLAWKFHYLDHISELTTSQAEIGKSVHNAIQQYTIQITNGKRIKDLSEIIGEAVSEVSDGNLLNEVNDIMQNFVLTHSFKPERIVGIEEDITVPIGNYQFRGIIDLLEIDKDTGYIVDYKSGRRIFSQAEANNSLQMSAYAMLAQKKNPELKNFKCKFDFVRHGDIVETERSLSDINVTEKYLVKKIETILGAAEQGNFPANPGHFCDFCSYVDRCPIEPDVSTGEELASQVLILEALLKDKRSRLKELVGKYGAISVNNEIFDFIPVTTEIYPPDKVIDVLVEKEVDNPFRFLKVDNKELKYLKPEIYEGLFKFAEHRVSTRFGHRREK